MSRNQKEGQRKSEGITEAVIDLLEVAVAMNLEHDEMFRTFAYRDSVALCRLYLDQLPVFRLRIMDRIGGHEELETVLLCGDDLAVGSRSLFVPCTRVNELARSVDGLSGVVSHMLDEVLDVRIHELIERHRVLSLPRKIEKCLRESKLVGCGVVPEENHASEIGSSADPVVRYSSMGSLSTACPPLERCRRFCQFVDHNYLPLC